MVEEKGVYIYANLLDLNEDGKIDMIADPHAEFARALGLAVHMGPILGERATRCAMIIDDGVLTKMMMEDVGAYEVSSPTHVITQL